MHNSRLTLGSTHELPGRDQTQIIGLAKMANDNGQYSVALGEHVSLGTSLENYPYKGGLHHPEAGATPYVEPIATMGLGLQQRQMYGFLPVFYWQRCVRWCSLPNSWPLSTYFRKTA